jgi:hypothetical protein
MMERGSGPGSARASRAGCGAPSQRTSQPARRLPRARPKKFALARVPSPAREARALPRRACNTRPDCSRFKREGVLPKANSLVINVCATFSPYFAKCSARGRRCGRSVNLIGLGCDFEKASFWATRPRHVTSTLPVACDGPGCRSAKILASICERCFRDTWSQCLLHH